MEGGAARDLVRVATGSWSPLYVTGTSPPLEVTGACCFKTILEVAFLSLPWAPSEVGAGYCIRGGFGNGTVGLGGYGTVAGRTVGDAPTVLHFSNIARTASMAASLES